MPQFCRSPEVVYEVVEGRALLVDPSGEELVTLNGVGTLVWAALDAPGDAAEIATRIRAQFPEVDETAIADDVRAFVEELRALGLVVPVDA